MGGGTEERGKVGGLMLAFSLEGDSRGIRTQGAQWDWPRGQKGLNMKRSIWILAMMLFSSGVAVLADDGVSSDLSKQADAQERVQDLSTVPVVSGRGQAMREVLESIIDTEYCGTAMLEGVTQAAALRGMAPVEGIGFVHPTEEDAVAVLCEMATEEFDRLAANGTIHTVADIDRLLNIIALLGTAKSGKIEALSVLDRIARKSTAEWDDTLFMPLNHVWVKLTIDNGAAKCLELGHYFQESRGVDSKEFLCFIKGLALGDAFGRCKTADDLAELCRFMGEAAERCQSPTTAYFIDSIASGGWACHPAKDDPLAFGNPIIGVPGWKGSVQRKHLAFRFEDAEKGTGPLHDRAAAELAADESELTDLREVYGDWSKELVEE